jgi:hypothetical protein
VYNANISCVVIGTNMPRIKNIVGKKFYKLFVVSDSGYRTKSRAVRWECLCDCGNTVLVDGTTLVALKQKSCGCASKDVIHPIKHGHSKKSGASKTYYCWANMIQRCINPKHIKYKNYGARGISVNPDWQNSFEIFLLDMGEKPNGLTLERIDVNKGYFKENCIWANSKTQANNKTSNRHITYQNKTMTVSQWADYLNINFACLRMRLFRNWSIEKAFNIEKTNAN